MAVLFDADISGAGTGDLVGGNAITFALVHLTSVGAAARPLELLVPDHHLRAGWIAFGRTLTNIGGVSRDYWMPAWYLDFDDNRFIPNPNVNGATIMQLNATRVRWFLSAGTAGRLRVES